MYYEKTFAETTYIQMARRILGHEGKHRSNVLTLLEHAKDRTELYPASTKYHHDWPGGLADHITQVMAIMWDLYEAAKCEPWEIVVAAYLHDWEKHWKYKPVALDTQEQVDASTKVAALAVRPMFTYVEVPRRVGPSYEISMGILLERFRIPLTLQLSNALMLSEGGYSAHAKDKEGQLGSLATVLHSADMISSHCYYDVSGMGARQWADKKAFDVIHAHWNVKPLGEGTWPR